jgi:hypothetical protein
MAGWIRVSLQVALLEDILVYRVDVKAYLKEKAKSLIEKRNMVKQRRVEDLGEALEVEDR